MQAERPSRDFRLLPAGPATIGTYSRRLIFDYEEEDPQ